MASPRSSRKFQLGPESVQGTLVPATSIWRGPAASLKDERKIEIIPEDVGLLVPTNRSITAFLNGTYAMPAQAATFEKLPYLFAASIKNVTTGVADGVGSGKVYAYPEPTSSSPNTIKTYTLEVGDSQQAEVGEFGFVEDWELTGAKDGMVMLNSAKWRVRQVANQAFTGALTLLTANAIPFNKGKLWVDDTGGTLGSTQKLKTFTRFTLKKSGGWQALPVGGDGQLYFSDIAYADPKYALDITFLHDASATGAKAKWRAETAALIRLEFLGNALTTAGTYTNETLRLDLAGKWTSFDVLGEQNGFEICTGHLEALLDATASLFFTATVVNEVASLV